ncbi:inactive TPR repeat-containing thioredoxin TTL3-like isoform X1 [Punica granatum]|uniref:Inactive TPR repeat-containing thioredoxin TTL3-like isoform X1 n=1 Tax=Punica granatum TaxID=22663 RepID=A0A6P8CR63_PUNGR|nr:inactive TPR repeat-containing thioredoxin TTL3-like isoform X1 [Punica granatum]
MLGERERERERGSRGDDRERERGRTDRSTKSCLVKPRKPKKKKKKKKKKKRRRLITECVQMSTVTAKQTEDAAVDSLAARFDDSLVCEPNKPDYRELDLGSPVSPLMIRNTASNGGATASSSSCSSSGSVTGKASLPRRPGTLTKHLSGELSDMSEIQSPSRRGHRRSVSAGAPLIYSSKPSAKTNTAGPPKPNSNVHLSGNICPSGKILKPNLASMYGCRSTMLGSGTGNYGHGSVIRRAAERANGTLVGDNGESIFKQGMASTDPEEVKEAGNQLHRRGSFDEALALYDRAISILPENSLLRGNRAATLTALGRLPEAVRECEEAVRLNPGYRRARQRLASLYLRLGQVENARFHLNYPGQQIDPSDLQKLHLIDKHIKSCTDARKMGDWKTAMREADAAIAVGADSSPQLVACKAEALLKFHRLQDADTTLSSILKIEQSLPPCSQTRFSGMLAEAYVLYVRSRVEMALGRFEDAIAAAEKASMIDKNSVDITIMLSNVKAVAKARARGNDLFSSGRYVEACLAYGEGLKFDSYNSVLYCNRAVCWSKLEQWEKSIEDCNQALYIQPNYTKALLRRAVSNGKLGRWAEAVKDYEVLRRELPGDNDVIESLRRAQVALKAVGGVHSANNGM